jgi:predicted dehydrogenase
MIGKIKIGWIGAGFVGQVAHLENFSKFEDVEITSLAEMRPTLLKDVGRSYNIPNLYPNHTELLKSDGFDAIVAIVNRRHTYNIAKDVLEAGYHLLTEKPIAQNSKDASELVSIAEQKSLIYSISFMKRYDLGIRKAKEILESDHYKAKLGKVISIRVSVEAGNDYCNILQRIESNEPKPQTSQDRIAPDWIIGPQRKQYEDFVNVASHHINLLTFLFNKTPEVKYVDFRPNSMSCAFLDYDEFPAVFEWGLFLSDSNGQKETVEIRFQNGEMSINIPPGFLRNVPAEVILRIDEKGEAAGMNETKIKSDYMWSFQKSDRAFIDAILSKGKTDHSADAVVNDFKIIDDIWREICRQK